MKKILITGGELGNKGAQAMTFITVSEVRKRFPEHEIILISYNDYDLPQSEKDKFRFKIDLPSSMVYPLFKKGGIFKLLSVLGRHNNEEQKRLDKIYGNTDVLIDVSGFALGSNWGAQYCLNYLNNILIAKVYGIRCFLMPQSFGPFDFKGKKGRFTKWLIKKLLPYPEVIYAREKEGFELLKQNFKLKNSIHSCDLVLNNKGYNLADSFIDIPQKRNPNINKNSVGIIPNQQNFKYGNKVEIIRLYIEIINKLILLNKSVYLLRHSNEDLKICCEIKEHFSENSNVIVLENDFNSFEFDEFMNEFDFFIASRYHSVVHAYKNHVPCIVLGWATKYHELLNLFGQSKYMFDVRNSLDEKEILNAVSELSQSSSLQSKTIEKKLIPLQENNVFDVLGGINDIK